MLICKNKKKLNVFIVFLLLIFVGPAAYYGVKYVLLLLYFVPNDLLNQKIYIIWFEN